MTKTTSKTRRETLSLARERGRLRPIVIELNSTWVSIRLKGMRRSYTVSYDQLWSLGAKNAAAAAREERAAKRKASRV